MSANHAPMHPPGCPRCDDRRRRLSAYTERLAWRHSPDGKKTLARLEMQRLAREQAYQETSSAGFHDHRRGRRPRLATNARRMALRAQRRLQRDLWARRAAAEQKVAA